MKHLIDKLNITKLVLNCFDNCEGWQYIIARIICKLLTLSAILFISAQFIVYVTVSIAKGLKAIV